MIRLVASSSVVALFAFLSMGEAHADGAVADCRVLEIKAKRGKGTTDPRLKPVASKLKRPPFNGWGSFSVESAVDAPNIERMKVVNFKLRQGGKLALLIRDVAVAAGKKPRLRITHNLDDKSGKRVLDVTWRMSSGDHHLIVSGLKYPDGDQLLATTCTAK